jgi:PAS domain S-box-containing protein
MNEKLKILHLEDFPSDAQLVHRILKRANFDFESIVIVTKEEYKKALIEFAPDIILSDHSLPSFNSHEAFSLLKESGLKIPFIIITGTISEEFAVDVIKKGADDYILKDRLKRLPAAIKNAVEKFRLQKEGQNSLDELVKNEKYYRALVENGGDAIGILNMEGLPTYVSPSIHSVSGYTEAEAIKLRIYELIHPEDREGISKKIAECLKKPGIPITGIIGRFKHKNGAWRWIETTVTNMMHDDAINGIVSNFRDVTEKKIAEENLIHANRLYSFISQINQTIVHVKDEQVLFDEACRIAIDYGKFKMAWIGIADTANGKINIVANGAACDDDVKRFTDYTYEAGGPIDRVLKGCQPYVILDVYHDLDSKMSVHMIERGFSSGISLAIEKSKEVIGVFTIYSSEIDFFNSKEVDLLTEASCDISFALDVFEKDKQRFLAEQKLKQTENSLKQSEQGYRQIVETAQEGIWVIDKTNTTTFVNKKMCDILEYSPKQMLGKDIFYFMDRKGKREAVRLMEDKKKGKYRNGEFKYLSRTGKNVWTNISSNPIFDDEGIYIGALAMVSDITEKKTLEDLLYKANQLALIGNWEIDLVNNTLYWSAITKQIHEVGGDFIPDVELGVNFYKEGLSRDAIRNAVQEAIQKGDPFDMELQLITAQNNELWVRVIGEAEFGNGKCLKVFGSFQDIDKRKKAEAELLNAYEEKDRILESIGDGFYALDKNWIITYWNKEAETLLGKKREEVIGKSLWEVYPDSIDTVTFTNYHDAVKYNTVQHYERYNEGLNHWLDISAYPSQNGLSVYFKDVDERKQNEIEHIKVVADIVQRNSDLEQFSYIVSHNLRSPVANIIGIAKQMSEDGQDPETVKMCNKYLGISVEKLDNTITDLNSILEVKKEIGRRKELVILSGIVEEITSSIQNLIEKENVQIITDFTAADEFTTIKSYLYSIFYNLISNSIKYSRAGLAPLIEITSEKIGKKLIILFKDNGSGIDLAKQGEQVFGLYKRFHENIEGKGMGLFMVKTQVEMLGGKITISSDINKGTQFRIEL